MVRLEGILLLYHQREGTKEEPNTQSKSMQKHFIIAYDIYDTKRAYRVRKLLYEYAIGGQKSALEVPLDRGELHHIVAKLEPLLKGDDRVHIVEVDEMPLLFGRGDVLEYDKGVIIV